MRAAIYCRVSSAAQEEKSSLDTQEAGCRVLAQKRGLTITTVAREVRSGADRNRPELDALLTGLQPGDVVIAYALDRLSRSQIDTAILIDRIENSGASLVLVTEDFEKSATGTFLRNAKAFVAELEREKIRERTQRGRRARAVGGKPIPGGKPPYGYLWANDEKTKFILDPETALVVRSIFDQALSGGSLRAIAANLDARGILTPYGRTSWTAATVRRVLMREMYSTGNSVAYAIRYDKLPAGHYRERVGSEEERVLIPNIAPLIVSLDEQSAVIARLATNQQFATRNNSQPQSTLLRAGFVRCGHCGWALRVNHPKSAVSGARYCCNSYRRGRCPNPVIAAHILDSFVWEKVVEILQNPSVIAKAVHEHSDSGGFDRDMVAMERLLEATSSKQARLARAVATIEDDDAAAPLLAELKALAARKSSAEAELKAIRQRMQDAEEEHAHVRSLAAWCDTVRQNLHHLTYEQKRLALEALGVQVHVWREGAVNQHGKQLPRWQMTLDTAVSKKAIMYPGTSSASGS